MHWEREGGPSYIFLCSPPKISQCPNRTFFLEIRIYQAEQKGSKAALTMCKCVAERLLMILRNVRRGWISWNPRSRTRKRNWNILRRYIIKQGRLMRWTLIPWKKWNHQVSSNIFVILQIFIFPYLGCSKTGLIVESVVWASVFIYHLWFIV